MSQTASPSGAISPQDVLDFWFEAGPEKWFKKSDDFDAEIERCFGAAAEAAANGAFDDWTRTPEGTLAVLLILDQFRRNIHRGTPAAFAADPKALSIAQAAVARGDDQTFPRDRRKWFYLPFEHSEDLAVQQRSVELFEKNTSEDDLKWAVDHRDIIARFGRFPHRNEILGRESNPEEIKFLEDGGFAG